MNSFIKLKHIHKIYNPGPGQVHAVKGINLDIKQGEFVAITGHSGCGKSTMLHIIGCLDRQTSGDYFMEKRNISQLDENALAVMRNKTFGFVFQAHDLLPRTNVFRNIELPLTISGIKKEERKERVMAILKKFQLIHKAKALPQELSGGLKQKVAILRAIINNPEVILADEPTGNLDSASSNSVLDFFRELHHDGTTIVMITHEHYVAMEAQRIITLHDGKKVSDTKVKSII